MLTNNNIIQIWDYEKKTCLKSYNLQVIENLQEVKIVRFQDQSIMNRLYNDKSQSLVACVMILTTDKLYQYKYLTDIVEQITGGALGTQNRCLEFIDSQYVAVGGDGVKIIDLKSNQIVKVMKGYHQKQINQLLSYKQNQFDRPRIVASSIDGTMACWNADTALESPAFKFLMQKKGKQLLTANDGQEILSIAYDFLDYQIVTVTDDHITVWSSLNGMEVNRYKNIIPVKELSYLNHATLPSSSYIGHGRQSEIYYLNLSSKQTKHYDYNLLVDLKNCQDIDKLIKIVQVVTNKLKTNLIAVATTNGLYVLDLLNYLNKIEFHHTFSCALTMNQTKEFVDDTGQSKKITNLMFEKLKAYEIQQEQKNVMYLSIQGKHLICNLLEFTQEQSVQKQEWSVMTRQCKQYNFQTNFGWDSKYFNINFFLLDSQIQTCISGRYIAIRNANGTYVVLEINNKNLNRDMMEADMHETLHFLSEFDLLQTGLCQSLAWHQFKEELIIAVPMNDKNNQIQIDEKIESQTSGFFKQKTITRSNFSYDSQPITYNINIYGFIQNRKGNVMQLIATIVNFPQPQNIFGVLDFYYITQEKGDFKALKVNSGQFYKLQDKQLVPVGQITVAPLLVKANYNGKYLVFIYDTQFSLFIFDTTYKLKQTFQDAVTDIYMWEDLIFYVTNDHIKMLTIVNDSVVQINLCSFNPPQKQSNVCEYLRVNQLDTGDPDIQLRPSGQLKILMIYDTQLIVVNQAFEISIINLNHPLIEFLVHVQINDFQKCIELQNKIDKNHLEMVSQILIQKNALEFLQFLNMDYHNKLFIELEHNPQDLQINADQLDVILQFVQNKEEFLTDLIIKLEELNRDDELEHIIAYGIQNQIFSQQSIVPLLSNVNKNIFINQYKPNNLEIQLQNLYKIFQL